ncbi:hypothetical protein QQ045_020345 [Rhodiola kirilowii]
MEKEVEVLSERVQGELAVSVKREVQKKAKEGFRWAVVLKLSNGDEFNAPALVAAMKKARNINDNLVKEQRKAIEGGPWTFMGWAVIVEKWKKGMTPADYNYSKIRLWLQVHNVPTELREGSTPVELASLVGKVVKDDLQDKKKDFQRRKCDCFRVEVDENNEYIWIEFKYERLPIICYRCGRLSHDQKQCRFDVEDPSNPKKIGLHLRADYQRSTEANQPNGSRRGVSGPKSDEEGWETNGEMNTGQSLDSPAIGSEEEQ